MRKRKWGLAVFAILGISMAAVQLLKQKPKNIESPLHRKGMFEWKEERIEQPEIAGEIIDQFQITDWYQELGLPIEHKKTAQFVKQLHGQNVKVYALVGETDWGYESEGQSLIQYLEELVQYNKKRMPAERFDGVMVDVEPYTRSRWKKDPEENMKLYVSGMIAAYRFAQEHDLIFIACIPRHYDDQGLTQQLEILIRDGCDEVAVMDYDCGAEAEKIETEAQLARRSMIKLCTVFWNFRKSENMA